MRQQKTKTNYQPFKKPFWKLLGGSLLTLIFIYGGIVWANGDACRLYKSKSNSSVTTTGNTLSSISGWSFLRQVCQQADRAISANQPNESIVNISDESNQALGQLLITNNATDKDYFVPLKTNQERNAFLASAKDGYISRDIDVCELGGDGSIFGNGIIGCGDGSGGDGLNCSSIVGGASLVGSACQCDAYNGAPNEDGCCEVTVISGQQCRVKENVISRSVVNQKRWIDNTAFEWENGDASSNTSDSENRYWQSKSNSSRTRCGLDGHFVGQYAYGPRENGDEWAKYRCDKSKNWTCFWNGCNYKWILAEELNTKNSARTFVDTPISNDNYNSTAYGVGCTEAYYEFSGTYEDQCYNEGNGGIALNNQPLNIFGQATANYDKYDTGDGAGWYSCQKSCSDYNRWGKQGTTPYAPAGCSVSSNSQTRPGVCNIRCNNVSTCTNNANCEIYDDGSSMKEYSVHMNLF